MWLQVMALPKEAAEAVMGTALQPLLQQRMAGRNSSKKGQIAKPQIEYNDLEMHRIVGTGQFGMVRVVRHIPTNQAYALKVIPLLLKITPYSWPTSTPPDAPPPPLECVLPLTRLG